MKPSLRPFFPVQNTHIMMIFVAIVAQWNMQEGDSSSLVA